MQLVDELLHIRLPGGLLHRHRSRFLRLLIFLLLRGGGLSILLRGLRSRCRHRLFLWSMGRIHHPILCNKSINDFLLDLAHRAIRQDNAAVFIDIDLNFFTVEGRSDPTNGLTMILNISHDRLLLSPKLKN
jgi:hypothetical protein